MLKEASVFFWSITYLLVLLSFLAKLFDLCQNSFNLRLVTHSVILSKGYGVSEVFSCPILHQREESI